MIMYLGLSKYKGGTNSAVQIIMVKGCVSALLVHATFDQVYLVSRVIVSSGKNGRNTLVMYSCTVMYVESNQWQSTQFSGLL